MTDMDEIEDEQEPFGLAYLRALQATLAEWDSAEDAIAYDELGAA